MQIRPPGDASYLLHGAEHLIQGDKMSERYYDNNPPMSFMIMAPAMALKILGIPQFNIINIYTLIIIALSASALYVLTHYISGINHKNRAGIITAFLLSTTIPHIIEFGQKDHLIAITLPVLLLTQLSLTCNTVNTRKSYILRALVITALSPFILIKPHYGIIPVAVILHRAVTNKIYNPFKHIDFIILGIATITYLLYIYVFHDDFLQEVLPVATLLYVNSQNDNALAPFQTGLIALFFTFCIAAIIKLTDTQHRQDTPLKAIAMAYATAASLSTIAFIVQNKGFSLHLVPTVVLTINALYLFATILTVRKTWIVYILPLASAGLLYGYIILAHIQYGKAVTHDTYLKSELVHLINQNAQNDSFFIEDSTTCATFTTQSYTQARAISRFPSIWFLGGALSLNNKDQMIEILDKFGNHLAEDINNHTPKMIAFNLDKDGKSPLKTIYKNHTQLQHALLNYKYVKTVHIKDIYPCYRAGQKNENMLTLEILNRID